MHHPQGEYAHQVGSEAAADPATFDSSSDSPIHHEASFQDEAPWAIPGTGVAGTVLPSAAVGLQMDLFGGTSIGASMLPPSRQYFAGGVSVNGVVGIEAVTRSTTDAGNLLGKTMSMRGLSVQRRNPVISDPRIRGSRVGSLPASGSFWVPARMDLDTTLSKIDSRNISDVIAVKGPYAARYGPGFSFIDFELLPSPRYASGSEAHTSTSFDYKANGEGFYGRQALWGGASDWGFRAAVGHRTGNDYMSGGGTKIPSSYNSRDVYAALGRDFCGDRTLEFSYLSMDQTGVELPGQAFDIDALRTDGCEARYVVENQPRCDRLALDAWYNRTRFEGSAQRAGKRRQFPFYDLIGFVGFTDVDSMSTGFRSTATWEGDGGDHLSVGLDLRFLEQELNEITSGRIPLGPRWVRANSPIPRSQFVNPGLFLEYNSSPGNRWTVSGGGRFDLMSTDVIDDPSKLTSLGAQSLPFSYIVGTDDFTRSEGLWAAYVTGQYEINRCWSVELAAGYAERPPSLTELYAAETYMFVLQNGANNVTGDPRLRRERLLQTDLALSCERDRFRARIGGFYGWGWDYITYENLDVFRGVTGTVEQVQLKYVNTDLATLAGAEMYGEYVISPALTSFAAISYVEGRDRTRNGDFATIQSSIGNPSTRDYTRPRGFYSGETGGDEEPLPGISPLESKLGLRLHQAGVSPRWGVELSARLVARQDRAATSLLETPTPGFTVWDIRGYWQATDHLLLVAGVENFGDRTYFEHLDFRSDRGIQMFQPGANFYFGGELMY